MTKQQIIATGAEAILIKQNNNLIKKRISKGYRIPELDEKLRKLRTRKEAKLLEKLFCIIPVPKIKSVNEKNKEIVMEFIEGKKLSENLDFFDLEKQKEICKKIGKQVSEIHNQDIIHGDLTTSNMILVESNNDNIYAKGKIEGNNLRLQKIYFIDFGLSSHSKKIEDKAVDLHLLRQALESKHFKHWKELFNSVLSGYMSREKEKILKQLEKVESRGRYKH